MCRAPHTPASRALVLLAHSLPDERRLTVVRRGRRPMPERLLAPRRLLAHYRDIEVHDEALGDETVADSLIDAAPDSYGAPVLARFDLRGS